MQKKIHAHFDDSGVVVYQAFRPDTVQVAVEKGTFGKGFGMDRLSWIKPSFGWILRRSKYATKNRMTGIAKIWLSHEGFLELLQQAVPTHFDSQRYKTETDWQRALNASSVIHQWDPERDLKGVRLDCQSIQIGMRAEMLLRYRDEFILKVEDVTPLALDIGKVVKKRGRTFPEVPEEKEYPLSDELKFNLGYLK